MSIEDTIVALNPTWFYAGRATGTALLDTSGHGINGTLTGDASPVGGSLFTGSGAPSIDLGATGECRTPITPGPAASTTSAFTFGWAFRTTATGLICLFSDETCCSPGMAVRLNNGQITLGFGTESGGVYSENHAGPSVPLLNDGRSHYVLLRHSATNRWRVDVDGANLIDIVGSYAGNLFCPGANYYLGDFSICSRTQAVHPGQLGLWFGIASEVAALDATAIVSAAGSATTGTEAVFPAMTDLERKLDNILAAVRKTY